MEADAVEQARLRLEHNRMRIRSLLMLPDPATGELDDDVFPRSAVMRFALDPRRRRMFGTALASLGMLAARWSVARGGIWSQLAGSLFGGSAARR